MDLSLKLKKYLTRPVALAVCLCFLLNTIAPSLGYAQTLPLPTPGTMVTAGPVSTPALIKGLLTDDKDPFRFEFILAPGTSTPDSSFRSESERLIKYFLAALATPEDELWVNLSPVEKDRIVPEGFGRTAMGRDLLAQDYLLKQITASLLHPDTDTGKAFWKKVYAAAYEKYGTIDIPVDTFNKVWITPDKATVYTNGNKAYIVDCRMKVLLESDYLASPKASPEPEEMAKTILREIVIPVLEKDVNEGEAFAPLRQVYHSLILAAWFKRKLHESVLNKTYAGQNRNAGLEFTGPNEQEIYQKYLEAYQKGAFNFIREEPSSDGEVVARKYFSGGFTADKAQLDQALRFTTDAAQIDPQEKTQLVQVNLVAPNAGTEADRSVQELLGNPLARNIFEDKSAAIKQLTLFLTRDHPAKETIFNEIDRMPPDKVIQEINRVLKMPASTEKGLILHDTSLNIRTLALRTTSGGEDVPQSFSGLFMLATGQQLDQIKKSLGEKFFLQSIRNYYLLLKALWIIHQDQTALSFEPQDLDKENSLLAYALSSLTVIRTGGTNRFIDGSNRLLSQGTWLLTRLLDKDEKLPHNLKSMTALLRKHRGTPGYHSLKIYLELLDILSGTKDRPDISETKKEELAAWAKELNRRPKKTETKRIESLAVNRLLRQAVQRVEKEESPADKAQASWTPEALTAWLNEFDDLYNTKIMSPPNAGHALWKTAFFSQVEAGLGNSLGNLLIIRYFLRSLLRDPEQNEFSPEETRRFLRERISELDLLLSCLADLEAGREPSAEIRRKIEAATTPDTYSAIPGELNRALNEGAEQEILEMIKTDEGSTRAFLKDLSVHYKETRTRLQSLEQGIFSSDAAMSGLVQSAEPLQIIEEKIISLFFELNIPYRKIERNEKGITMPTVTRAFDAILEGLAIPADGKATVLDLGSGQGHILLRLAMARPDLKKIIGIEWDSEAAEDSRKAIRLAVSKGWIRSGQIEVFQGDFNDPFLQPLWEQADRIYYAHYSSHDQNALAKTMAQLTREGTRIVTYPAQTRVNQGHLKLTETRLFSEEDRGTISIFTRNNDRAQTVSSGSSLAFSFDRPLQLPGCRIMQGEYPLTEPPATIFPVIDVTLNGEHFKIGGRHYVTVTLPDGKKVYWGGQHNLSYSFFFQHFGSQVHGMVMQKKVNWLHIDEHHDLEQYTNQTLPLPDITNVQAEIIRGYAGAGVTFANYLGYLKASGIIQDLTHVSTVEGLAKIPAGSAFRAFDFDVDITVDQPETGSLSKFQAMLPDLVRLAQASDVVFLTNSSELTRNPPGVVLHIDFHQAIPFNAALIAALAEKADRAQAQVTGEIEIQNPPNEIGSQGIHVRPSTNLALFFQNIHAEYPGLEFEITSLVNNEGITETGVIGWLGGELSHQSSIRMSITSSRYPQPVLEKLFAFIRVLLQDQSFLEGNSLSISKKEELKTLMSTAPDRAMAGESLKQKLLNAETIGENPVFGRIIRAGSIKNVLDPDEERLFITQVEQSQAPERHATPFSAQWAKNDGKNFETFLLISPDGKINGEVDVIALNDKPVFLHSIWTRPSHEGRGTFILQHIFLWLKEQGVRDVEWFAAIDSLDFYHKVLSSIIDYETRGQGMLFTAHLDTLNRLSPQALAAQQDYVTRAKERTEKVSAAITRMKTTAGTYQIRKASPEEGSLTIITNPGTAWAFSAPTGAYDQLSFDSSDQELREKLIAREAIYKKSVGIWEEMPDRTWAEILPPDSIGLKIRSMNPDAHDAAMTDDRPRVSRKFILLNPYHIHTKPSTVLSLLAAKLGNKLGVTVMVKKDGYGESHMTNAMGLLSMFITYSQEIEISVQGDQSPQVLTKVLDFVERAMQDWHMLEEGINDNPLYDAYLQEIDRIAGNTDAAQSADTGASASETRAQRLAQIIDPAKDERDLKIVQRQFKLWPRRTPGWTDGERRKIPEIIKSLHEAGFSLRGGTIQQENGEESMRLIEGITGTPRSAQSLYSESLKVYHDQGGWPAALKAAGLDPDEIQAQPGYTELFALFRDKKPLKWGGPLGPVLKDFHEEEIAPGLPAPEPDAAQTPGGIDMNPSKLDLEETGPASAALSLPLGAQNIPEIPGLVPVILDIRPAGNLRELLGAVR